jgi:hypothetical protein
MVMMTMVMMTTTGRTTTLKSQFLRKRNQLLKMCVTTILKMTFQKAASHAGLTHALQW